MKIPRTINPTFDYAIEYLIQYHPIFYLIGPALDVGKRPKGLRSDKEWSYYINQFTQALLIGQRNKWLRIHVDGKGQATYWKIDIPPNQVKGEEPIWSDE